MNHWSQNELRGEQHGATFFFLFGFCPVGESLVLCGHSRGSQHKNVKMNEIGLRMFEMHIWSYHQITPPKLNIAPEKWWLEAYFPIGKVPLQGLC